MQDPWNTQNNTGKHGTKDIFFMFPDRLFWTPSLAGSCEEWQLHTSNMPTLEGADLERRRDHSDLLQDTEEAIRASRRMIDFIRRHKDFDMQNFAKRRESIRSTRRFISKLEQNSLPRFDLDPADIE